MPQLLVAVSLKTCPTLTDIRASCPGWNTSVRPPAAVACTVSSPHQLTTSGSAPGWPTCEAEIAALDLVGAPSGQQEQQSTHPESRLHNASTVGLAGSFRPATP